MTTKNRPPGRKLFTSMMVSLDGFIEGPDRELDWHLETPEFDAYCEEMLAAVDLMLFGRVSYEMMIRYWPAAETDPDSTGRARAFARQMNETSKIVLSRTLEHATWTNTRVVADRVPETIRALKQEPGKSIAVFGGAGILRSLAEHDLIDEYRLILQPVVLGRGRPLFDGVTTRRAMRLVRTQTLGSRLIALYYQPEPR